MCSILSSAMDLETSLICIAVVAVSATVVFLTSLFGARETSYEEAVLEQRKRSGIEPLLPAKAAKKQEKKDKKEKEKKDKKMVKKAKKEKVTDKEKDDKEVISADEADIAEPEVVEDFIEESEELVEEQAEADLEEVEEVTPQTKHDHHKDRVEFKDINQIIILNDEEQEHLSQRRVSSSGPRKPILVHKQGSAEAINNDKPQTKARRGNSFDIVHPKDEFELIKHQEEKSRKSNLSNSSSREDLRQNTPPPVGGNRTFFTHNGDFVENNVNGESEPMADIKEETRSVSSRKGKKPKVTSATYSSGSGKKFDLDGLFNSVCLLRNLYHCSVFM